MEDKVVVITGASDGVGAAAARAFHDLGATVVPVGRSPEKTARIASLVGAEPLVADFARLESVRRLADELSRRYDRVDILADNAGGTWPGRQVTEDGHELTFQVNHLAPFLLTTLLRHRLRVGPGRVVVTSSAAHSLGHIRLDDLGSPRSSPGFRAYATSKLENVLFASELARRWAADGIMAASFHPGAVATQFGRHGPVLRLVYGAGQALMRTPEQGADTLVWLAAAPASLWRNGAYYTNREPSRLRGQAADSSLAAALWERSAQILGIEA